MIAKRFKQLDLPTRGISSPLIPLLPSTESAVIESYAIRHIKGVAGHGFCAKPVVESMESICISMNPDHAQQYTAECAWEGGPSKEGVISSHNEDWMTMRIEFNCHFEIFHTTTTVHIQTQCRIRFIWFYILNHIGTQLQPGSESWQIRFHHAAHQGQGSWQRDIVRL